MTVCYFETTREGIAAEEALLARQSPSVLVWRAATPALTVPRAMARRKGVVADDENVVVRGSGGGVVPQGPGTTNIAMVVPVTAGFTTDTGYRLICETVGKPLSELDVAWSTGDVAGAFCDGSSNVTVDGRKLAGTAQRWRHADKGYVALLHAAILVYMPTLTIWRMLAGLHDALGGPDLRQEVHVALGDLVAASKVRDFDDCLLRAGEQGLAGLQTWKGQAA